MSNLNPEGNHGAVSPAVNMFTPDGWHRTGISSNAVMRFCHVVTLLLVFLFASYAGATDGDIRLYTLDCGHGEFKDFSAASDTGDFDGQHAILADPCFLIRHPKGWLLWDAGNPATLPASITGGLGAQEIYDRMGIRVWVDRPLVDQLSDLGLKPDDINYVAFSHLHFDHVGNANLFTHATWILNRAELAWALDKPAHVSVVPELFSSYKSVSTQMIDGDYDVFGDGRVRILKTPGHTPGSSVLLLMLNKSGAVLLSGDLYLTLEGREKLQVPTVNADRAATLASMNRVEAIVRRLHARVVVQHSPEDFARLPQLPGFLD